MMPSYLEVLEAGGEISVILGFGVVISLFVGTAMLYAGLPDFIEPTGATIMYILNK